MGKSENNIESSVFCFYYTNILYQHVYFLFMILLPNHR